MNILILGAGAIGGYYGGRLAEAGAEVTFLVRPGRAAQLARDGLVVESPVGDIRRKVATVGADTVGPSFDVVILTCKAYDLDSSIEAIRPAMGPTTVVLPLLNGLRHLDRLDDAFGAEHVLGGLAQITGTLTPDGRILHLSPLHRLVFGSRRPVQEDVCQRLAAVMEKANFDGVRSDQILQEMWEKHAFIATLAGATCLMRAAVCDIMAEPMGEGLMTSMQGEAALIADACGTPLREKALQAARRMLTDKKSPMVASMLRDVEAGRATEADHVIGDLLARGRENGVEAPLLDLAYLHLRAAANRLARESA
ncbi:MAG: 2-dehydropantoate 2-reductase [Rhodospirillales bacterium]